MFTTIDKDNKSEEPGWYRRFCQVDSAKSYLIVYSESPEDFADRQKDGDEEMYENIGLRPLGKYFLHNAKIIDNGKKIINGSSDYFSFKITTIGKPISGTGVDYVTQEIGIQSRRQQKIWMRCIGKVVKDIANLEDIKWRYEKPSKHELHDWRSKRVVVKPNPLTSKSGDKFSRRRPTLEDLDDSKKNDAPPKEEFPKSISKHPTDHRWNLSENNFYKTPARPRTQTQAPCIPDGVFQSIYKNDLDNILIFVGTHRQFDSMEGRNGGEVKSRFSVALLHYYSFVFQ